MNKRSLFVIAFLLAVVLDIGTGQDRAMAELLDEKDTVYQPGAEFFFYAGAWSADLDINALKPVYKRVILNTRPPVKLAEDPKVPKGDYFVVSRGHLRVLKPFPARQITPGYRDSVYNVMTIDGREVHRKNLGDTTSAYTETYLSAGYHPYEIVWFKNKTHFLTMYGEPSSGREVWHRVPFEARMQTELLGAFTALETHIKGTTVLTDDQIDTHRETIKTHRYAFGQNRAIVKAALELVNTFETVKGPLWRDHPEMNKRRAEPKGINWAIYHVMQYIMDEVYTAQHLAKYADLLDGYRFQSSDYFPGKCATPVNPNETHRVKIWATQKKALRDNRMYGTWPAVKPTGTYLAPGTIATVTVPEAIVGKNFQVRVGAHYWDNTYKPRMARLGRCTTVFPINSNQIKVANPLGGAITIEVPYLADHGVVDVTVANAVRSPYFSAKPFHKTTLAEWRDVERNFKAPWAFLQSERFMMNVPTSWISRLEDPVTLMQDWDKTMDAVSYLFGFPAIQGKETMYVQVDRQMRATVFAPGYPSVNATYDPKKDYGGYPDHAYVRGPQQIPAVELHERCHAFNIMHLLGEREATVHLPHVAAMNLGLGVDMDKAFQTSCTSYDNLESRTIDNNAISWMVGIYFSQKQPVVGVKYKHIGHVHWVDLARLFGWEALHRFYLSYNMDYENGVPYGDSVDIFSRLCESAQVDLRPLFHFWGRFNYWDGGNRDSVKAVKLAKLIADKNLPASAKIYDQLVRYKSMVLEDNTEFQSFTTGWWGRQPRIKGWCHENGHARQWGKEDLSSDKAPAVWPHGDIYDETSCARVKACVQDIIDMYFPNGRP
ncbi:MAG: hypothetical protein GY809_02730 [Planctomycetes bacterium]|nr:hypothetical protein [Planctomycetota bacterium]